MLLCQIMGLKLLSQDVLYTVNVQHDCISNQCHTENVVPLLQEGEVTLELCERIIHRRNPDQMVLNMAQMWSTKHIQPFRVPSIPMDATEVILGSVQKEITLQNHNRQTSRAPTLTMLPHSTTLPMLQPTGRPASCLSINPPTSMPSRMPPLP